MPCVFSANQNTAENADDLDAEITVTQSQVNLSCPLTQVRLSSPAHHLKSLTGWTESEPWFEGSYKSYSFHSSPLSVFQVVMVNPVKNKKCNHNYDEEAILSLIETRVKQKKTCR